MSVTGYVCALLYLFGSVCRTAEAMLKTETEKHLEGA